MARLAPAINSLPPAEHDDRPRLPHIWAAQAARRELDFMAWTPTHALAARFVGTGVALGAVLGLIVGGIREVLRVHARRHHAPAR